MVVFSVLNTLAAVVRLSSSPKSSRPHRMVIRLSVLCVVMALELCVLIDSGVFLKSTASLFRSSRFVRSLFIRRVSRVCFRGRLRPIIGRGSSNMLGSRKSKTKKFMLLVLILMAFSVIPTAITNTGSILPLYAANLVVFLIIGILLVSFLNSPCLILTLLVRFLLTVSLQTGRVMIPFI